MPTSITVGDRGVMLSPQQIKNALLERYAKLVGSVRCILLGGSYAEGFTLPGSDVDILMIVDVPADFGRSNGQYCVDVLMGTRFEVMLMDATYFSQCLSQIMASGKTTDGHQPDKFICPKVISGDDYYQQLMSVFDIVTFQQRRRSRLNSLCINKFEDVIGARSVRDWDYFNLSCRELVATSLEVLLNEKRDFYSRPKWQLARAHRLLGGRSSKLFLELREALLSISLDQNNEQLQWGLNCLNLCRWLQLEAFFPDTSDTSARGHGLRVPKSDMELRSDPLQFLARIGDDYLLVSPQIRCAVDSVTAAAFLCLRQRLCYRMLVSETTERTGETASSVRDSIAQLKTLGFIEEAL